MKSSFGVLRFIILALSMTSVTGSAFCGSSDRIGEAKVPGPSQIWFSTSNPTGLRGKEQHAIDLGVGVHCFSETHLSSATAPSCASSLRFMARSQHRELRVITGADVPVRAGSTWAGTWAGALTASDLPARSVSIPWGEEIYASSRVQMTQHFGGVDFTVANIYGYSRGPTWPKAKHLTEQILAPITEHLIIGGKGPRLVMGDLNFSEDELDATRLWQQYGWISAQRFAQLHWGATPKATCKGKTERDYIFMSPEAQQFCRAVQVDDIFVDHATISVQMLLPDLAHTISRWPLPPKLQWDSIDLAKWSNTTWPDVPENADATDWYAEFGRSFESSLNGFCTDSMDGNLSLSQRGRAQRVQPEKDTASFFRHKPSRMGEVRLEHDTTHRIVYLWFKQLRRLQSLKFAIASGKMSPDAQLYRAEVWSSVLTAKGFDPDFRTFWNLGLQSGWNRSFLWLPLTIPSHEEIECIFDCFHAHFKSFEQWHIRLRLRALQEKHDRSMKALHQELRKAPKDSPDLFWLDHQYEVLSIEPSTCQLHLDRPLRLGGHSVWWLDEERVEVLAIDDCTCTLDQIPTDVFGDRLCQHQVLSEVGDIQTALLDFWKPRWNAYNAVPEEAWTRIVNFTRAYLPQRPYHCEDMSVDTWRQCLKKYKPQAARGLDGFHAQDLAHLPDAGLQQLVDRIQKIETGQSEWPLQMQLGVVQPIAKVVGAHDAHAFRPIVILSIVQRVWSRLRSRELLLHFQSLFPAGQTGFIPGQEAMQIWGLLQAQVELALQQGFDRGGWSTDLVRAFNQIPRAPLFLLARHLGVPERLMHPWTSFLQGFQRAFRVRDAISEFAYSSIGLPEGCAMSVFGMAILDYSWHCYMAAFCPRVACFSYVDNLSVIGTSAPDIAQALACASTFWEMWQMTQDLDKSYCWGTSSRLRTELRPLPIKCALDAAELGGSLSFGKQQRNSHLRTRCLQLGPKWMALRRSRAPNAFKLAVLPLSFWPEALHGAMACRFSDTVVHDLRQQAGKALGWCKAGVNLRLRLSLSLVPKADPGFWHVNTVIQSFRRLCMKSQEFFEGWQSFMHVFDGRLVPGPYTKLIETLNMIAWAVDQPPFVVKKHVGFRHHLLWTTDTLLHERLYDAWLQSLATTVQKRRTMVDLQSIDAWTHQTFQKRLGAGQQGLLAALNSGAFLSTFHKSKFDCGKIPSCSLCEVQDDVPHWFECPLKNVARTVRDEVNTWPRSFCCHLLPPRCERLDELHCYFAQLPPELDVFYSGPTGLEVQHLFTDGSCISSSDRRISWASWAILNSSKIIAASLVSGLEQTIARAETLAILCALQWTISMRAKVCVWSDSRYVVRNIWHLQKFMTCPWNWSHQDLWQRILTLLQQVPDEDFQVRWIPSHLDDALCESPFEDWVQTWNNRVDSLAVSHNQKRPDTFYQLVKQIESHGQHWLVRSKVLLDFFSTSLEGLKGNAAPVEVIEVTDTELDEEECPLRLDFLTLLPLDWADHWEDASCHYPIEFAHVLLDWLHARSSTDLRAPTRVFSFVEIAIGMATVFPAKFPFRVQKADWKLQFVHDRLARPTAASLVHAIRNTCCSILKRFHLEHLIQPCGNLTHMGIFVPQTGLRLTLSRSVRDALELAVKTFTDSRPLRTACDLARPF